MNQVGLSEETKTTVTKTSNKSVGSSKKNSAFVASDSDLFAFFAVTDSKRTTATVTVPNGMCLVNQ